MTLNLLRTYLRRGMHPEQLPGALKLGAGCYRTAYAVGRFVVKGANPIPPFCDPRDIGMRRAPTVLVRTDSEDWEIQPFYTRLEPHEGDKWYRSPEHEAMKEQLNLRRKCADLHSGNIGIDRRGRFVAFDW